MKKTYVKPEIEELIIELESMVAATIQPYEEGNGTPGINLIDDGE